MKMRLSKILTRGSFTYEYRDTGDAWSTPAEMINGVLESTRNFVSPVCDELRITGTLLDSEPMDRVHLCGLEITSGLQFDVTGTTPSTFSQLVYTEPTKKHRQTLRFAEVSTSAPQITITGIGQRQFNLRQIAFCGPGYSPDDNFVWESPIRGSNRYRRHRTAGSSHQSKVSSAKGTTLNFRENPSSDFTSLQHFIDEVTVEGYCLFERSTESDDYRDSYLAVAQVGQLDPTNFNLNNFDLDLEEAIHS